MVTRQTLVVGSVVLLATLAVMVPAVSAAPVAGGDGAVDQWTTQVALQSEENATANGSDDESAFGNQMTAFMQSNAAQTEDTVEHGMWEAGFERANESDRARLAQNRADELTDRVAELRERNQTLYERYKNGSLSRAEYVAEASRLSGQIEALEDGVNGTTNAAERAGLNVSALNELRTNARNMSGPEVAGVARSLTSGDRGPPEGVPGNGPPGEDGTERPGGGPPEDVPGGQNGGVNDNRTVAPGNGGNADNRTQGPDNPGNGNDAGQGQGNGGGDAGSGNGPPGDGGPGNSGDDDGAPGNGQSGDGPGNDAPGADAPGNDDDDGAPGNSGNGNSGGNDAGGDRDGGNSDGANSNGGNDDEGNSNGGNRGGGDNSNGGNSNGGNSGQGNDGDGPGRGPASLLTTDILFTR